MEISAPTLNGKVENGNCVFDFNAESYLCYELYRQEEDGDVLIKTFEGESGKTTYTLPKSQNKTKFYLITKIKNHATKQELVSEKSNIVEFVGESSSSTQTKKSWYV